jgi:hypothetical protein
MATPLGTNVVTSIVRQTILPQITDNIYDSNSIFFRINQSKRFFKGGTQLEPPLMYSRFLNGGSYTGFEELNVAPNDTVKTAAFDWKQYYVPVSVDGLTLIKTDSPEAIADHIKLQMKQAEMEMAENLGTDLFGTTVTGTGINGLGAAIDSSDPGDGPYGGLARGATNPWWSAGEDSSTTTMTLNVLNNAFNQASVGGRHPSLIVSGQDQYARFWALGVTGQSTQQGPIYYDEQLYSAGFTNLVFNGVPWVQDDKCNVNASSPNTNIYFLNEDYIIWGVSPRADMRIEDFQTPITQDAMATKMLFAGALMLTNCKRQFKLSAITA